MPRLIAATAIALLSAAPALAQEAICGGISVVGAWVGGDEAASDLTVTDAAFEGEGQVPIAGHLVRMFNLSAPTDLRIDARAVPSGDPYATIFDADGTEVATDDDSLGGLGARIEASLEPGAYCLAIRSYEPGMTDVAFAIGRADASFGEGFPMASVEATAPDAAFGAGCFEEGAPSLGEALDAAAVGAGPGATGSAAEAPAYRFSLSEPTSLAITATGLEGDPLIRLLDESLLVVAENDDFDGLDSRIEVIDPLPAGDYCVEVQDLSGSGADITVALAAFDASADRARRLALAEFAPTADDDVEVTDLGTLDTSILQAVDMREGARWFQVDVPEGGLVLTEAIADGADPIVTLFDRAGRRVGENDDGPDGLDSLLVTKLMPGSYMLAVRLAGAGLGSGSVRLLMERYEPAR